MMESLFGLDVGALASKAVATGSIGVFFLFVGRVLRRARGLAAYLWLFGGFLTLVGVLVASGVFDVDVSRTLELARMGGDVVRTLGRLARGGV